MGSAVFVGFQDFLLTIAEMVKRAGNTQTGVRILPHVCVTVKGRLVATRVIYVPSAQDYNFACVCVWIRASTCVFCT